MEENMESKSISSQEAKSSIETFLYLTRYLRFENTVYFQEQLKELINYTETDSFFNLAHENLLNLDEKTFNTWFESQTAKKQRGAGLNFPPQAEERVPLVYLLLKKINDGTISLHSFFHMFFKENNSSLSNFEFQTLLDFYGILGDKMSDKMRQIRAQERAINSINEPKLGPAPKTINIQQHIYSGIGQIGAGEVNKLNASIQKDNNQLLHLFSELEKSIKSLGIASKEKEEHLETVDVCRDFLIAENPKIKQAKTLLNHLPAMGNIASIISAIIAAATSIPS